MITETPPPQGGRHRQADRPSVGKTLLFVALSLQPCPPWPIYQHMKRNNGFTLVELMITLVVAAILAAIAVPNFSTFINNNRLTTQANAFITAMNLARGEAIKRAAAVDVTANGGDWSTGWTVTLNSDGSTLREFAALQGNSTLTSTGSNGTFQYQANGTASATDTLQLCDDRTGETGRQITLGRTGRVSVTNYTCP